MLLKVTNNTIKFNYLKTSRLMKAIKFITLMFLFQENIASRLENKVYTVHIRGNFLQSKLI